MTGDLDANSAQLPLRGETGRFVAVVLSIALVWNLVGNLWLPGSWYVPANVAVAAVLLWLARRAGLRWSELGLSRDRLGPGVIVGVVAVAAIGLVIAVLVAVPATRSFFEVDDVRDVGAAERWFVVLVRIPLGTAVFEEVLFRSVLLGALLRVQPRDRALVANAALFGVWHVVPAWEGVEGFGWGQSGVVAGTVVVTALAGAAFAALRLRVGSVVAPTLAHASLNGFAYIAAVVAVEAAKST